MTSWNYQGILKDILILETNPEEDYNVKSTNYRNISLRNSILFYFLALALPGRKVFASDNVGDFAVDNAQAGEDFSVDIDCGHKK